MVQTKKNPAEAAGFFWVYANHYYFLKRGLTDYSEKADQGKGELFLKVCYNITTWWSRKKGNFTGKHNLAFTATTLYIFLINTIAKLKTIGFKQFLVYHNFYNTIIKWQILPF